MTRVLQALCLFIVTIGVWGPALAQDPELAKFYGRFVGSGVADNSDSAYFRTSVRDFEVLINPIASGFNITWSTTTRSGTPANPKNFPNERRTTRFPPAEPTVEIPGLTSAKLSSTIRTPT